MEALLKVLPIYVSLFISGIIFGFVNTTFWLSKVKSGMYTIPLVSKVFETWWGFTLAVWCFNAPFYVTATLFVAYAYKTSVDNFGVLYSAFVIGHITSVIATMFFMYTQVGEMPNRKEWIALALVLVASLILANSRNT